MKDLKTLTEEYNRLATKPVKRLASKADAVRRIAELRSRRYPLKANRWHAMNPASAFERREVIEMVFNELVKNGVASGDGWATVRLRDARLDGMDVHIWAGHLTQLRKEGRYRPVKNGVGAVLVAG